MRTPTSGDALVGIEHGPAGPQRKPRALASRRVFLLAAATPASVLVAISARSLALDLDAYAFLQTWPSGVLHPTAAWLDGGARVVLVLVVASALLAAPSCWREACVAAARVASGAFVGELLKTALERPRPSALPGMTTGNSLPSGHIMNTTLVAIAACELAGALPRPFARGARALAILAVVAQAVARVLHGSHWPSDVLPSVLLGVLWMRIAEPLSAEPRRRAALVVAGVASYAFFLWTPAARIHLPSALDRPRIAVAVWSDARSLVPTGGAFEDDGAGATRTWSATLHGSGSAPEALEMVAASRCHGVDERCRRVRLSVDGSRPIALALRCGWHWYYARPAAALSHAETHSVALEAPAGCPRPKLAVQSLALVADRPVGAGTLAADADVAPPT